jgi:hypothetical protein
MGFPSFLDDLSKRDDENMFGSGGVVGPINGLTEPPPMPTNFHFDPLVLLGKGLPLNELTESQLLLAYQSLVRGCRGLVETIERCRHEYGLERWVGNAMKYFFHWKHLLLDETGPLPSRGSYLAIKEAFVAFDVIANKFRKEITSIQTSVNEVKRLRGNFPERPATTVEAIVDEKAASLRTYCDELTKLQLLLRKVANCREFSTYWDDEWP